MIFKGFKNIPLPYNKQALIRYTCLDYNDQPQNMQQKIDMLCSEIAQGEANALLEVMITECPISLVSKKTGVSTVQLKRYRKRFYIKWYPGVDAALSKIKK